MPKFTVELSVRRVWWIEVDKPDEKSALKYAWWIHDEVDATPENGYLMDELVVDRIVPTGAEYGYDPSESDEEGWG